MNKRDDTPKQDESPDAARRGFLQQASALGAGAALTAAPLTGMAAGELASGMTGGPTGFAGAERFQYNDTMSEGRAIAGIKKLKAAGKVPKKLTMLLTDGAIGQITKPFPVGKVGPLSFPAGAPSVKEVWERETGIEIDIVGVPAEDIFKKVMQDVTTGSGVYDIYTGPWNSTGDLVASGGAVNCDAFVKAYKPDWGDAVRGTPTPEMEKLLYTYGGSYYAICLDGDFQTWFYLKGLYERADIQKQFSDKYGYKLAPANTWEEVDKISEFFTGKDFGNGPMAGNPGGYFDPFQQANFKEPLVSASYQPYTMDTIPKTIARSAPTLNFAGQTALDNALDQELQAALTGQKTAKEAMIAAQKKWEQIIKRQEKNGILKSIAESQKTWPTGVDPA